MESATVVDRKRFSPALLNAWSSFTVDPTPTRRTGTDSLVNSVGPETGPIDELTALGCNASVVVSARKAPQVSTAARRASAATMADADCCRGHRDGITTPKLTVLPTLPAEMTRLPPSAPPAPGWHQTLWPGGCATQDVRRECG